ncbi:bifunctional transcriptional activator/DNA repair enzyme AdaA [Sphingobium algorifonticola]|uniref:methylated-DNA--[protein]-cysteine S-methyltransferase n=1 Tax=Sphingobium algorifonticola TaxID=2008318 RepID=A0A437JD40_9SPHN|nr:methylated-DNA--[protein]-cysteine S-methyltransferase [Sphingobium algorifonticola]RVT43784.1 methylated-DNA--[protein]-cysteine S-methyltransferase [Sphingobium algorifonticola]
MTTLNPTTAKAVIDDPRYARLSARDPAADGQFYYGVKSTGVFCRPSCPARLARPDNIVFFDTAQDAQDAGFRACLRCHPLAIDGRDPATEAMRRVAAYIDAHVDQPLSLRLLADQAGLSRFHFQRTFKAVIGVSPREYQAAARLKTFKALLRDGEDILGATFEAGYGSTSRVYETVTGGLGMTPSAYRAGGAGESIAYALRDTALGPLMMAATDRGVCFVEFGMDAAALYARLEREFPAASLVPSGPAADAPLDAWIAALDDHLSSGAPRPDLPLDMRGTAFQLKVWKFLLSVRPGDVVSYSELAQGVGAPKAVRAAASACAANRIGVLIPCHRALRADGGLGGYRWGLAAKRTLLDRERAGRSAG